MKKGLLFEKAFEAVMNGSTFQVDFKTLSLKIDGKFWVKDGQTEYDVILWDNRPEVFLLNLAENYKIYKHSIPTERSESKRKKYFRALPEKELSDQDMMYGWSRDVAQIHLELMVLCNFLGGMKWQESWGKWFWQCPTDPDLVMLREWFEEPTKAEGV